MAGCRGCGRCCQLASDPDLEVKLTPAEAAQLTGFCSFRRACKGPLSWWMDRKENGDCVMFDSVTRLCKDYEHRPLVCRDFNPDWEMCKKIMR